VSFGADLFPPEAWHLPLEILRSGQKSSSNSTNGQVTSIGFDINPSAKNKTAAQ